ncbi:hypothetical protein C6501_03400 [Candidatus Poribacteria bacterium]|nr:MAG: hypothetical protein C6501_03400 [Candidatus Poribacteria bacterium]
MKKRNIKPRTQDRAADNGFISKIKHGAAALIFVTLLCGVMTGCDRDEDSQELVGRAVAYENASGELTEGRVDSAEGDMLFLSSGEELHQSEVLGLASARHTSATIVIAKGNYLDAYGDRFADIEYLIGGISSSFYLNGEHTVSLVEINYGDTASGEQIALYRELGGSIALYIRADEYWLR